MARIAFFHNALGKTDGVSLEVDKWRSVLESMGHDIYYCAGNVDVPHVYCIPELSFDHPITYRLLLNGTVRMDDYNDEEVLRRDIEEQATILKGKLLDFIQEHRIEVLIPNNLLSVGYHIPAVLAFYEVIQETGLKTIVHSHDFYFEDSGEVSPTCAGVLTILNEYAPPKLPNVHHVVINQIAQHQLKMKKGIHAEVVPNVFDFHQPSWKLDEYNVDFRSNAGIGDNDIVFLQATRILDRKGIELAIEVLAELNKPEHRDKLHMNPLYNGKQFGESDRIVLLCAGYIERFGISGDYYSNLKQKARKLGVDLIYKGDIVKHSREYDTDGSKVYSLWDTYVNADFVTYPSVWEGWGNQFIEAVFARLPVVLFEYPVYITDLKKDGFDVISLGHVVGARDEFGLLTLLEGVADQAAHSIVSWLTDPKRRNKAIETNAAIGVEHYSFERLRMHMNDLFAEMIE